MGTSPDYDVIVIGLGAIGSATCDAIARRGATVLGLEQFDLAHGLGSSGGQTRLIRRAYFEHPDYVPLLEVSYAGWDDLGRESSPLLHRVGCVYAGRPTGELISGTLEASRRYGIEIEEIGRDAMPSFLRVPSSMQVLREPEAGFVLSERSIAAFIARAREHGADLRGKTRVTKWRATAKHRVEVHTERGSMTGRHVVVTAGAWTGPLAQGLGVPLRPTRQALLWTMPSEPGAFEFGQAPCWAVEEPAEDRAGLCGLYYGFPILPPELAGTPVGAKIGHHRPGPQVDPDVLDRHVTPAEQAVILQGVHDYVPSAASTIVASTVCMYTMSPDGHFLVGKLPGHPNVSIACGLSGHGFKFAPALGAALADLALDGQTALPIAFLDPQRFGG